MPRMPNAPKPSLSVRATGKLATRGASSEHKLYEYKAKETCPLCIEDLDSTDLEFSPCPCGYRVCLFCYEQLKVHCKSQCPGCRREYGKALEEGALVSSEKNGDDDVAGRSDLGARSSSGAGTKMNRVEPNPGKRSMEEAASSVALPSGATWGASSRKSVELERSTVVAEPDEAAWPSLASVSTNSTNRQRLDDTGRRRSNNASASSSMDQVEISQVSTAQQQQAGKSSESKFEEAEPGLSAQHVGDAAGNNATARLMAFFNRPEEAGAAGDNPGARLMAMLQRNEKAPPPGFAPTNMASPNPIAPAFPVPEAAHSISLSPLNNLENPIVPSPPLGRYSPISPPIPPCGQSMYGGHDGYQQSYEQHHHHHHQYMPLGHQSNCVDEGTYSVWSGLPGLDLCTLAPPASPQWQEPPVGPSRSPFYQGPPGMGHPMMQQQRPMGAKPPPPGFGGPMMPPPGFGGHRSTGSSGGGSFEGVSTHQMGLRAPPGFGCVPHDSYGQQHGYPQHGVM